MFQHKIQVSVEYKEFFIVRHILCAKCTYLICIDLVLACAQVMKIWIERLLPVFANFLVLQFSL